MDTVPMVEILSMKHRNPVSSDNHSPLLQKISKKISKNWTKIKINRFSSPLLGSTRGFSIPKNHDLGSKEWTGKTIYFNFSSIFGDLFLKFFEEEVSDYLSWPDSYVLYVCAHNYAQNFHQGDCMQSSSKVVDSKFSI